MLFTSILLFEKNQLYRQVVPEDKRDSSTVTRWSLRPYKHMDKKKVFLPKQKKNFKFLKVSASEIAVMTKCTEKRFFNLAR